MSRVNRVQVQVDMQLEFSKSLFDIIGGVNTDDDIVAKVAAKVFQALTGELGAGDCQGYARIKGAVETRNMWSALQDDWLE